LKKETIAHDKTKLLEKEIATLTEKLDSVNKDLQEIKDLKNEIKGLKLFLGRVYPEFKTWFPEIMQKVYKKK
jgi:CRISPR/Cas system CMR-associated protein Cmr5 small subunit